MFMSSGHWQNTGLARWVNKNLYHYNANNEKSMNPMRWHLLQNDGDVNSIRETINGFPCRLILVNDGTTSLNAGQQEPTPGNTKDMGIFNFNNDKDNVETLGFDTEIFPNCMSFEVTANSDTSAGAFVPYSQQGGTFNDIGTMALKVYSAGSLYKSAYMDKTLFNSVETLTLNIECIYRFYDKDYTEIKAQWVGAGASYALSNVGNFEYVSISTYQSTNDLGDKTLNNVTIMQTKVDEGDWVYDSPFIVLESDGNEELTYLQNSFELRYPDEDDVGKDYGYLGMEVYKQRCYTLDYWINYDMAFTTCVDINLVGNSFEAKNLSKVVCMQGSTWLGDCTGEQITVKTGTTHVSFASSTREDFYVNGELYKFSDNVVPRDTINNPTITIIDSDTPKFSTDYGLKRVIDWVGNCTNEEFKADFEKYFNKQYVLRYYLLVITLG